MTNLKPPLQEIENRLFDPSPPLIDRWLTNDQTLPEDTRHDLEKDPRARFLREIQLQTSVETHDPSTENLSHLPLSIDTDAPLPGRIAALIHHHLVTRERYAGIREPEAGQMRLISPPLSGGGIPLDWDMSSPMAVLLWRETATPGVWSGWLLASETDYATDWDILLEREDEPYDPLVAMIQLWNPVQIALSSAFPILGQLSAQRLETLATAFADSLLTAPAAPIPARPGHLMERLVSNGQLLLCGTPLGGSGDPRRRYQELYLAATEILKESARLAVAAHARAAEANANPPVTDWLSATWERLSFGLRDLANQLGQPLLPLAPITAMGAVDENEGIVSAHEDQIRGYRIPGMLDIEALPLDSPVVLKLRLSHQARQPLALRLLMEGDVLESHCLTTDQPQLTLFIEPQPGLSLEIQVNEGPSHRWSLHP